MIPTKQHQRNLVFSIALALGSLLQQGTDKTPRNLPGMNTSRGVVNIDKCDICINVVDLRFMIFPRSGVIRSDLSQPAKK